MLNKRNIVFVCLLVQILFNQTVFSEVYKWADENGHIIYGDKPGTENADKLQIKRSPVQNTESKNRIQMQEKLLEVMQQERNEKIANKKKAVEEKKALDEKCAAARKELQETLDARVLYQASEDPDNPIIFTDEERSAYESELQNQIKKYCK